MDKTLADKIKTNRKEYYRLLKDENYTDVRFNPKNGALLAIHREHHFDSTIGKFGIPRGDYEKTAIHVLYDYGKRVVLWSEKGIGIKRPEGLLDGKKFEIKSIEGTGKRNIEYKIYEASAQEVETVVLYYHEESLFSKQQVVDGYNAYKRNSKSKRINTLYYIVDKKLYKFEI